MKKDRLDLEISYKLYMPIAHTRNANALCYFPCIARDASQI